MVKNPFLRTLGVGVGSKILTPTPSILRSPTPSKTSDSLRLRLCMEEEVENLDACLWGIDFTTERKIPPPLGTHTYKITCAEADPSNSPLLTCSTTRAILPYTHCVLIYSSDDLDLPNLLLTP